MNQPLPKRLARRKRSIGIGVVFVAIVILPFIFSHGCSLEERKSAKLRGHTVNYSGVEHGFAAAKGARFCQDCHGAELSGGSNGEPSCYQCHGLNWLDRDPGESQAPEDHTAVNGRYHHHTALDSPVGTCTNCHGAELAGGEEHGAPSCYLCHGKEWE